MTYFDLRVQLPPAHLFTAHGGGLALCILMLNVKQGYVEYGTNFYISK